MVESGYADEEQKVCTVGYKKFSNTVLETCIFSMEVPQTVPSTIRLKNPMIDISYVFRVRVFYTPISVIFLGNKSN